MGAAVGYAALKATEYQCTADGRSSERERILSSNICTNSLLDAPCRLLGSIHLDMLYCSILRRGPASHHELSPRRSWQCLVYFLLATWAQANQFASLSLVYITLPFAARILCVLKSMTKRTPPVKKKRTPLFLFAKRTPQVKKLISHVEFLQKLNSAQRQQIWKHETTIAKKTATIQSLKAKLKARKTIKAAKSMKAK